MKKYIQIAGVSVIALLAIFSLSAATASAQTPVTCPEGYTCGPVTPEPCYVFNLNLQIGSRGNDVDALVAFLIKKGFIQNPSNEPVFGEDYNQEVANAVSAYQTSVGVPATGFVGPLTRAAMNADCVPVVASIPSITSIRPESGPSGTPIAIYGSGFLPGSRIVWRDGAGSISSAADSISSDGTNMTGTVPHGPMGAILSGLWNVSVNNGTYEGVSTSFVITSSTTPVSKASAKVTSSSLELGYSGFRNEALLTGTYTVEVSGGTQGVYIYKIGGGHVFADSKDVRSQANSQTQTSAGWMPLSPVASKTDQYGQTLYVIPAGKTVSFKGAHTIDPKQMFAGTYYGSLISVWANPNTTNIDKSFNLEVSSNKTNTKTIVGEKSPYISSVNSPVKSGDMLTVKGQRLNDVTISIDGITQKNNARISRDATTLTFILPKLADGQHVLVLNNKSTGSSNRAYFDVNGGIQSASSANVTAGTLALNYDQNRNEVGLSAPFSVSVTAGSNDIRFENDSAFGVMYSGKGNPQQNFPVAVQYINKQPAVFPFILKAGQKAEFYMIATANPLTMFAGSYSFSMNGIYVSKNNGAEKESVTFNSNTTNSVVIIGEKSPYITSVTTPGIGSQIWITGLRLNNINSYVYRDGVKDSAISLTSSTDGTTVSFPVSANWTPGSHSIQLENSNGRSNIAWVTIGGTAQPSITVTSPSTNSVYTYDSNGLSIPVVWSSKGDSSSVPDGYQITLHAIQPSLGIQVGMISSSNISTFKITPSAELKEFVANIQSQQCPQGYTCTNAINYYVTVNAYRNGPNGLKVIASGNSGKFAINYNSAPSPTPSYTANIITRIGGRVLTSSEASGCTANVKKNGINSAGGCVYTLTNLPPGNSYQVEWLSGYPSGADTTKKPTVSPSYPQTLGERPAGVNPVTFYIDFQPAPVAAPTATFTIEGQESYTYNPGMTNHYKWSSTNADTFSSSYTATGGTICGGGPWVANTASGTSDTYMDTRYLGCTWTVTYTAKNSVTGKSASDTVTVKLVSQDSTGTPEFTFISSDTDSTAGPSANDDVGLFAITYRVTAVGDTVYVSSLANPVGLTYAVEKGGSVISSNNISASIVNSTDTTLTSSGNYEIEEGESETFTLYVSVPLGSGNTSGQYRMSLTGVKWDSVDRSALSKTYSSGLEQFRTNYQVLNAIPNPRKTASVLDALGGFFRKLYGFDGN